MYVGNSIVRCAVHVKVTHADCSFDKTIASGNCELTDKTKPDMNLPSTFSRWLSKKKIAHCCCW